MSEQWKAIPGTGGLYEVSNLGRVRSHKRKTTIYLRPGYDTGYARVQLIINKQAKTYRVHRLVAAAFIPNPHNKPQVNHKDGDKTNNHYLNLEWCTNSENQLHAYKNGLNTPTKLSAEHKKAIFESRRRQVTNTTTGVIYESIKEASQKEGIKRSTLTHYLLGTRKNKTALEYYDKDRILHPV